MSQELQHYFPEYDELEKFFHDMVKHSIENNYNYDSQQKKDLKFLELSQYFKEYCYGMVNKGYITHENKEKIISRIKALKNIRPYEEEGTTYGHSTSTDIIFRDCLDVEKGRNLSKEIYAKTFFHELTHHIFSDNFLISGERGTYPISQNMIDQTNNHYYLGAFRNGGFIDELIAQDTAEEIYNAVNGVTNFDRYSMYNVIREPGRLFAQSINNCENVKDLAIRTFSNNWIEKIMQENRDDYNLFVKIMTTLQSKIREEQTSFNPQSSPNNSEVKISIKSVNRPNNYIDMNESLIKEDILSDDLLTRLLHQKKEKKVDYHKEF